jgi:hypothetical protein
MAPVRDMVIDEELEILVREIVIEELAGEMKNEVRSRLVRGLDTDIL